jgi:hypothetical protein
MNKKPESDSATKPWASYVPSREVPWNLRRVIHLHRRAGFAATWGELQRNLQEGPQASIDQVLTGKRRTDPVIRFGHDLHFMTIQLPATSELLRAVDTLKQGRTFQLRKDLPFRAVP